MRDLISGRVSIIVPVYNTSVDFLKECFDSVAMQDYADIELIVVNDGSTNKYTNEFCTKYFEEYDREHIYITAVNEGVSCAREKGIMEASGSMCMFLDSDDALVAGCVSKLVACFNSEEASCVIGQDNVREHIPYKTCYFGKDNLKALIKNEEASFGWALWAKLFDTSIMRDNYKARKDIFYGEDLIVNALFFASANKCVVLNEKVYRYRTDNPDSAMAQAKSPKKLSLIKMWKEMAQIFDEQGLPEERLIILANYYDTLLSSYLQCMRYKYKDYKNIMRNIRAELKSVMPKVMLNPHVRDKKKYKLALNATWLYAIKYAIKKEN